MMAQVFSLSVCDLREYLLTLQEPISSLVETWLQWDQVPGFRSSVADLTDSDVGPQDSCRN